MSADAFPFLATFAFGPESLAAAVTLPLIFLVACASPRFRKFGPIYLALAPIPALAASVLASDSAPLVLDQMIYPIVLVLDPPGALLLGVSALLWLSAGIYAAAYMREEFENGGFTGFWLATLIGNVGVFMAADVGSFYLFFAMVSLPAYGLLLTRSAAQDGSGGLYVAIALLGEAFLILAFAMLTSAAEDRSLLISDGVAALPASPWRDATIVLLIAGFGTKIGILPFHIWMPSTYRSAPIPAAAVLSGGAVNAGVIGLLRFIPWSQEIPVWGHALVTLGMFAAFYGVAIGLTQRNTKTILAYSSVSQMGLVAATLGAGLAVGNANAATGAALYAAHHGLAKGGLFLAAGVIAGCGSLRMRRLIPFAGLLALSLAGLPITGGAIAKLAIKEPLGSGLIGVLSNLSVIATTLLMLHFLWRVAETAEPHSETPGVGLIGPWLGVIAGSISIPTIYFFVIENQTVGKLDVYMLWETLWPVLIGALLYIATWRWGDRLPITPEGDVVVMVRPAAKLLSGACELIERPEFILRRWPVAGVALLVVATMLAGAGLLKP
jgi:formate hydrogenlyase subunit 3/multisubunit Na+/H+ antiporter MnhD subunit